MSTVDPMDDGLVRGADGRARCGWGAASDDYIAYHDDEWGRPVHDDVRLFEKLCLEGFQSGLSWLTILRKRAAFRAAFAGFDPLIVAGFDGNEVDRLLADAGIVRHRGKIEATINNARRYVDLRDAGLTLDRLVWSYAPKTPYRDTASRWGIPATSPESTALSKDLRTRGWKFVGPTTVYAFMQSMGITNDHLEGCWAR
jgi:DNA-3-methyladenine glycosylase I